MSNEMKVDLSSRELSIRVVKNGGYYVIPADYGNQELFERLSEIYGVEARRVKEFWLLVPSGVSEQRKEKMKQFALENYTPEGECDISHKKSYNISSR